MWTICQIGAIFAVPINFAISAIFKIWLNRKNGDKMFNNNNNNNNNNTLIYIAPACRMTSEALMGWVGERLALSGIQFANYGAIIIFTKPVEPIVLV